MPAHTLIIVLALSIAGHGTAHAGLLRCTQANGKPLFTDIPAPGAQACTDHATELMPLSVNSGMDVGNPAGGRSARTQREIDRARRARQALQANWQKKERKCQRARTRAAAAWPLSLQKRKNLNLAAFHACQ